MARAQSNLPFSIRVFAVPMSPSALRIVLVASSWSGLIFLMVLFLSSSSKLILVTYQHDDWLFHDVEQEVMFAINFIHEFFFAPEHVIDFSPDLPFNRADR